MPWQVGIDEAGYGPNLGPFVMTMVTASVPADRPDADLWRLLRRVIRKATDKADERLLVADSKKVYSSGRGLNHLEAHVGPFLWQLAQDAAVDPLALASVWEAFCLTPLAQLLDEPWCNECGALPAADCPAVDLERFAAKLQAALSTSGASLAGFRWVVVFPRQFNGLVAQHGSKGAVSQWALEQLLPLLPKKTDGEHPSALFIDKHGGRNCYYEMLLAGLHPEPVLIRQESARCSHYRADLGEAGWEIRIEPEADDRHFTVALASMFSKYLREILMLQFNRFWQRQVPGLQPTAGYPGDATRFWRDIRAARKRLGIAKEVLWRVR